MVKKQAKKIYDVDVLVFHPLKKFLFAVAHSGSQTLFCSSEMVVETLTTLSI